MKVSRMRLQILSKQLIAFTNVVIYTKCIIHISSNQNYAINHWLPRFSLTSSHFFFIFCFSVLRRWKITVMERMIIQTIIHEMFTPKFWPKWFLVSKMIDFDASTTNQPATQNSCMEKRTYPSSIPEVRRRTCRNYPSLPNRGKRPIPNISQFFPWFDMISHIDDDPEQEEEWEKRSQP